MYVTIVICLILLPACGRKVLDLPPEEVVRRAVIRSSTVDSVSIALSGNVKTQGAPTLSGSIIVQSVVRSSGHAWSADASFNVESMGESGFTQANGRVVLVAPGNGQIYLRPESLDGMLGDRLKRVLTGSVNGWWVVGEERAFEAPSLVPDPAMLSAYGDAIDVMRDFGVTTSKEGRKQYHYAVALKSESLIALDGDTQEPTQDFSAQGELWIDAEDFTLSRATWDIQSVPSVMGPANVRVDATFSRYDRSPQIQSPAGTAATLHIESIFAIFSRE